MSKPAARKSLRGAVIGHPISHSLSPKIFQFLSKRMKTPLDYRALDIPQEKLREFLALLRGEHFVGCNVTIPHKERILRCMDSLSPEARFIGAVNVVHVKGRRLIGHNTDAFGFRMSLLEQKAKLRGKSAVVYGAGGAAKAVAYVLAQEGVCKLWLVNRTLSRAQTLASRLAEEFPGTEFRSARKLPAGEADLVSVYVNATPVGMKGFPKQALLPRKANAGALAMDLVYRPARTPFLKAAERQGLKSVGGLDMLIWQALGTWALWFGPINGAKRVKTSLKAILMKELEGL